MPTIEEIQAAGRRRRERERESVTLVGPKVDELMAEIRAAGQRRREREAAAPENPVTPILESGPGRFAASVARPWVETIEGITELTGREPDRPLLARTRELGTSIPGRILGELSLVGLPAARAYSAVRAATRPGTFTRALAPLGAESGAVGGMEALRSPEEGRTRLGEALKAGAFTAATGGVLSGIGAGARRMTLPSKFPKSRPALREQVARRAAGEDPFIPLYQAVGEAPPTLSSQYLGWTHQRALPSAPILGRQMVKQQEGALTGFRDMMLKRSVPEGAMLGNKPLRFSGERAGVTAPVADTVGDIQKFYRQEYSRLLDPIDIATNTRDIQGILSAAPKRARKQVFQIFELASGGKDQIPGSAIKDVQRKLREAATQKRSTPVEKDIYWSIDDILEESIQRRLGDTSPQALADYQRLAAPYRNFLTVQTAVANTARQGGAFRPEHIVDAAKNKKGQSRAVAAAAEGPLQREGVRASEVYRKLEKPDLYRAGAAWGLLGGGHGGLMIGSGMALGPFGAVVGATPAVGTLASAYRPIQQYLMREQPWQQSMARALRQTRKPRAALQRGAEITSGTTLPEVLY